MHAKVGEDDVVLWIDPWIGRRRVQEAGSASQVGTAHICHLVERATHL